MSIRLNGQPIDLAHRYPDGTYCLRMGDEVDDARRNGAVIDWKYRGEDELVALIYLAQHLRSCGVQSVVLRMPYIPNARLDRVKCTNEVFTLKHFAGVINSLGFDAVRVLDPHSDVSTALIDRVSVEQPKDYIQDVFARIVKREGAAPLMFYPDEGAMKRYSSLVSAPYAFGIKKRDWETGKITALEIHGESPAGRHVLMVDDICSRGGTFYHSALALKKAGAANIYIYVTHCEDTIFDGELLKGDLISHVYTTDSILDEVFDGTYGRITIFRV